MTTAHDSQQQAGKAPSPSAEDEISIPKRYVTFHEYGVRVDIARYLKSPEGKSAFSRIAATPQQADMPLFDRIEFALRDAGFGLDEARALAEKATAAPQHGGLVPQGGPCEDGKHDFYTSCATCGAQGGSAGGVTDGRIMALADEIRSDAKECTKSFQQKMMFRWADEIESFAASRLDAATPAPCVDSGDDARFEWLSRWIFEGKWDGCIGRKLRWTVVSNWRHPFAPAVGHTLREAIDAAMAAMAAEKSNAP